MTTFPTLVALLFLALGGSCITIIVLLVAIPIHEPVISHSVAPPGTSAFSKDELWFNKVTDSSAAQRALRTTVICVLSWVIAGTIIMLIIVAVKYMLQHAPTKQQRLQFKRTYTKPEEWELPVPEKAWSPTSSDFGKEE